jgi:nucleoside-diphosphate-sugar epimerase
MAGRKLNAVTGAFGYTGKYISRKLLDTGDEVVNLTGTPGRPDPFGGRVKELPLTFDDYDALTANLGEVATLYNTYWVRFTHGGISYQQAVDNTMVLIDAAERAGVKRVVHVSITNPSEDSPYPYFSGKAFLEDYIKASMLSHAIIRPAVIFGKEDILINNIAWLLRHLPVFAIPGDGKYELQPVFVEDMADICVSAGKSDDNMTIDAVGPEVFTFNEMVELVADAVGSRTLIAHMPKAVALNLSRGVGVFLRDVLLTSDEVDGLMAGLLVSDGPPTGTAKLSKWLMDNRDTVGMKYASELGRHYR